MGFNGNIFTEHIIPNLSGPSIEFSNLKAFGFDDKLSLSQQKFFRKKLHRPMQKIAFYTNGKDLLSGTMCVCSGEFRKTDAKSP